MKLLLKIKHWQLFLLLIGCMVAQSFFAFNAPIPFLSEMFTLVFLLIFIGWLASIGFEANRRLPSELQASQKPMFVALIYAALYAVVFSVWLSPGSSKEPPNMNLILPFHILAMAGIFYSLGYTAKRLTTMTKGQKVSFYEYSGPFFLLWFFPIGVWFVQPRVNALLGSENA